MLYLYLAALILGGGVIFLQLFAHAGHGGGGGHDVHADHAHDDAGAASIFLSARFWTFALLAFGMVGTAITLFGFAGPLTTALVAGPAGLTSGLFAALVFRALKRAQATSSASLDDAIGQIGRVLLPCGKGRIGKVRLQLKGQAVDVMATTGEEEIAAGKRVIVEEMRGGIALVVKAPEELEG